MTFHVTLRKRKSKEKFIAGKTEKECFNALGLPYFPPELREDIAERELFECRDPARGGIPALIEQKDIKGDLHVHSTWSDGRNTIAQMADAARIRGYQYLAVSDHSQGLRVARGVSAPDLKRPRN